MITTKTLPRSIVWFASTLAASTLLAGPYSSGGSNTNAGAVDAGIPGFVGVAGDGVVATETNGNYINPIFKGWATGYSSYVPHDLEEVQNYVGGAYSHPEKALGPVTGSNGDIVSLDDMNADEIAAWLDDPDNSNGPGELTLTFNNPIYNGAGADFATFENSFASGGGVFAELGYVEVSTNGTDFARFPSISLTESPVGGYGTIDPTGVYNLVGKHVNAYNNSFGTPFDLDDLLDDTLVLDGVVDLNEINYVRIVDIPGDGTFLDSEGNPIYDAWHTFGSGGVDFEALGVINQVPEPAAYASLLGALSLLGVTFYRRRARNA
ncbi:MAG: cell surface protein [Puniceicoccaceae bacterium 5H]|nr:MAG: cell surface protein [Puniceicoccaceae bacterium 5H]